MVGVQCTCYVWPPEHPAINHVADVQVALSPEPNESGGSSTAHCDRVVAVKENALGEFLRARRDQVQPEDVGLVPGGHRRVLGLRREELAMPAGISAQYYLRLERGRATNPSPQVLVALACVLQLDPKATKYLHELARPVPWPLR